MATALSADRFVAALRAEGVKVAEHPGWKTHNRNHRGPWGPVHGVMQHHTVTGRSVDAVALCKNGHADLPGPLCIGVIERDGRVHLVGYGRTNHAGGGDPNVLAAVKDERYNTSPPDPHQHQGSAGAVDGNSHFYGFECANLGDGKDPWSDAQVEAMVRVSAAICRAHSWTEKSVIGHKEWSDWKSDPRGPGDVVAMPNLRARINERLSHAASWSPGATKPPPVATKPPVPPRTTMTEPLMTHLTRPEDVSLLPGSPYEIRFTAEFSDDPNDHPEGGYTFLQDSSYWGRVSLDLIGLAEGEYVDVRIIETPPSGTPVEGDAAQVDGRGDGMDTVKRVVPIVGRATAGKRVSVQVTNRAAHDVLLTFGRVMLLSRPL